MPDSRDVQRLLSEAAHAPTLGEAQQLVAQAEHLRGQLHTEAAAQRDVDLAGAQVRELLTPVAVHEHHTAATDWIGTLDTTPDANQMQNQILAQATLWHGKLPVEVRADDAEFSEQARGMARRLAGQYGEHAPLASQTFLEHVGSLHGREAALRRSAADAGVFPTGSDHNGLPLDVTTSERANVIQQLESPNPGQDLTQVNDPGLGQADTQVDRQNGDVGTTQVADAGYDKQASRRVAARKGASMPHAQCPTCGGHGRVAVRAVPQARPLSISQIVAGRKVGYSGLPQVDQVINPSDTAPEQTPLPPEVMWPWDMNGQENDVPEAEQQIKQRQQMSPTATAARTRAARMAAQLAYRHVMGGQDDSGWMGDMGQSPVGPGEQDGGNPGGPTNLQTADEVYGYGGDNGNQPLRPFGQDEADDEHNNPSQWAPGQPAQADVAGRLNQTAVPGGGGPAFPNPPMNKGGARQADTSDDPEIQKALAFVRRRRAHLETQAQKAG